MLAAYVDALVRIELATGHVLEGLLLCFDTTTGWAVVLAPQEDGDFAGHAVRADSVSACSVLPDEDWALEFTTAARHQEPAPLQRPKKKRRSPSEPGILRECASNLPLYSKSQKPDKLQEMLDVPDPIAPERYWAKRYQLFAKYAEGVKMDTESWYSVTPQSTAEHIAERVRCSVIIDVCTGAGGNAIQFAQTCVYVMAIDNNPTRIAMAKHNAKIYGVDDRIEFILGDAMSILEGMAPGSADVVFASPPWGGMDYTRAPDGFDLEHNVTLRTNHGEASGLQLLRACQRVSSNVAFFLPRNVNKKRLGEIGPVALLDTHIIRGNETTCCAYFGSLF